MQDIQAKIFPLGRRKIDAPDAAAMVTRIAALEVDLASKISRVAELETELATVQGEVADLKRQEEVMLAKFNAFHMQLGQKKKKRSQRFW